MGNSFQQSASSRIDEHSPSEAEIERRLGPMDRHQVAIWREMSPARRLDIAFQAYQFALDAIRAAERQLHPDLGLDDLARRVARRMQGNPNLGR